MNMTELFGAVKADLDGLRPGTMVYCDPYEPGLAWTYRPAEYGDNDPTDTGPVGPDITTDMVPEEVRTEWFLDRETEQWQARQTTARLLLNLVAAHYEARIDDDGNVTVP